MDYSIRFTGHIIRERKPTPDWPDAVVHNVVFRANTTEDIFKYLNDFSANIKKEGGMFANVDLPDQEKSDPLFGNGKWITMYLISHISFSVRWLSSEMPNCIHEGEIN